MKEIWINLELYLKFMKFLIFKDFSNIFMNFLWISKDFPELKIDFSEFY